MKPLKKIDLRRVITYDNNVSSAFDVSTQIRRRRRELGLSQAQLARRVDTSVPTLSRYENGWSRFELSTLRKLATALGCELVVELKAKTRNGDGTNPDDLVERIGRLFWDTRLTADHLEEYPLWVVERVLELGNLGDVRGLIAYLGRSEFLRLAADARLTSARTREFWLHMLDKEGMTCTRKFSREAAERSWRSSSR